MKKVVSILCSVSLLFILFTGCSQNAASDPLTASTAPAEPGTGQTEQPEQSAKPIAMRMAWWGGDSRHAATLKAIEAYKEAHPNVTIEAEYNSYSPYYTKLLTQLASGTTPDIVQLDYKWVSDLMKQKNNFLNLNDYKDIVDMSQIDPSTIEKFCVRDGFMIGLPIGISGYHLMFNTKAVADLGLVIPEKPTWDDLIDLGQAVQEKDSSKYLFYGHSGIFYTIFKSWIMQKNDKNLINDSDRSLGFSQEDAAEYFAYVKKMYDTRTTPPMAETAVYGQFPNVDTIPGWIGGSYLANGVSFSLLPSLMKAGGFDVDVVRWPVMENAVNSGIITQVSVMFGVSSKSENTAEALDFINWYVNDQKAVSIMGLERGVPLNQKAAAQLESEGTVSPQVSKANKLCMENPGRIESSFDINPELETIFFNYWQNIGYGRMTPEKAAAGYIADVTKWLQAK
jgi:oligogalacturonide transport system substrate-binding protein